MYDINCDITIGSYKLAMFESFEVVSDVEALSDTATITLPGMVYNKALDMEDKIKRGDKVVIKAGYGTPPKEEFVGYLDRIQTDGGSLKLICEDSMFLYKTDVPDIEFANVDVNKILEWLNGKVSSVTGTKLDLNCDYSFTYEKFTITNNNAFDVLKVIQEEAKPNIYMKGDVLHVHPIYSEVFGKAIYDFSVNIEKDDLEYKDERDKTLLVIINYTETNGTKKKYEYGKKGGDKITFDLSGVKDISSLKQRAENEYTQRVFTGYEGTITGWLVPECRAGYEVLVKDKDYPNKNGWYYVLSVTTTVSASGGIRVIKLGKKLRDA